jgi:hypothetical protein
MGTILDASTKQPKDEDAGKWQWGTSNIFDGRPLLYRYEDDVDRSGFELVIMDDGSLLMIGGSYATTVDAEVPFALLDELRARHAEWAKGKET